jgi:hypothetical protein
MQDQPTPIEILGAVAEFLRSVVAVEANPHTAFQARVAANAVEMVRRQLDLAPAAEAAELERLRAILGRDGSLAELTAEFAERIASGALDLSSPGVADQLWAATLAKLAVDQPTYSGYRAALAERAGAEGSKEA